MCIKSEIGTKPWLNMASFCIDRTFRQSQALNLGGVWLSMFVTFLYVVTEVTEVKVLLLNIKT